MMKRRSRMMISSREAGARLGDFLVGRFSYLDRDAWMEEIARARVLVNGQPISVDALLQSGDCLEYLPRDVPEPRVNDAYEVLFEDEALLVVNKPGNLPCHPGGRYFHHTLWARIRSRSFGDGPFFVHRIDRETSGIVVTAKNSRDASVLGREMASGQVRKRYVTLVEGRFPQGIVTAEGWLDQDRASAIRKKMRFMPLASASGASAKGKYCRTRFDIIRRGSLLSLVSAIPGTGRRHQIRATLLALGYPVVGDKIYGTDETFFVRFIEDRLTESDWVRLRLDRQALHAAEIAFRHPRSGRLLCFEAPVPEAFQRLVEDPP